MSNVFDVKWQKDLLSHVSAFASFVFEGNVHDLHPLQVEDGYEYLPLKDVIGALLKDKYCVVYFDHTKQPGKEIRPDQQPREDNPSEADDSMFNSFSFLEKSVTTPDGRVIPNPNVEIFKKYYHPDYLKRIRSSADQSLQGGITMDMQRIHDAMKDFGDNVEVAYEDIEVNGVKVKKEVYSVKEGKDEAYKDAKPFFFILPNVSRYMTRPGDPDDKEHSLLMVLYEATQLVDTPCKVALFVDKMNDLPTWFEAADNNPSLKKFYIANPNSDFRKTYYELELNKSVLKEIDDPNSYLNALNKFCAYTEKYSLRKLEQLKQFIVLSTEEEDHDLTKIDKTVFKFEFGANTDPWRKADMFSMLDELEDKLNDEIKGQEHVSSQICASLRAAITGVNSSKKNDRRPKAVFFLAGPTGTGKTEMCRQLSTQLFGKEDSMIRFDMSEFRESHNEARLFGAPPGYIGYEAGGELTKAIKENPFCVLLFDEIEKASSSIWDKFLQILGDGRVTDGKGETVYFSQCVIVFTSNLGITASVKDLDPIQVKAELESNRIKEAELVAKYSSASESEKESILEELKAIEESNADYSGIVADVAQDSYFKFLAAKNGTDPWDEFCAFTRELVTSRIKKYFDGIGRREVLGRIGEKNIIVYNFIDPKISAPAIAKKTMKKFAQYLLEDNSIPLKLDISDKEVWELIKKEVTKLSVINLGGRGITMTVEKLMSEPVADYIFTEAKAYKEAGNTGVMPVLEGKLVVKDDALVVVKN